MRTAADTITNSLAAAAIGVLQLGVAISLAALIFSGPLADGAGRAAAGFVLGTAIVSSIVGATTKMTVVTAGAQDTAAVMVAAVAVAIVASPDLANSEMVPTVIVMIALAGVATGLLFWALGHYGLTTFVRYLPFPVVTGFTAGTGWLLFRGGLEVMHGRTIKWGAIGELLGWNQFQFLVPGLILASIMVGVVSTRRLPNALVSIAILGGVVLFHLIGRNVSSISDMEAGGWFIGPFDDSGAWSLIGPDDLRATNWSVLLGRTPLIVSVVAVSVIGLLLNLSGLESDPDPQIDMNAEMRTSGIANVFCGLSGGLIGYHLLGDTLLGRQLGARGRTVPITIAVMAAVTFVSGPDLIGLVPRSVAGGVLAGLGVSMLVAWARAALPQMTSSDRVLSALILIIIAVFGVLTGVGAGVAVAAAVFIVKYSRTDPIRHVMDAAGRSTVDRSEQEVDLLARRPDTALAFELQGYLFFGSIAGVRRRIDERIDESNTKFVIIDFARVTGIDSTASSGLASISTQLAQRLVSTVWSGLRPEVAAEIDRKYPAAAERQVDLDHAIAWCEDRVLTLAEVDGRLEDGSLPSPFNSKVMATLQMPKVHLEPGETLINVDDTDSDVYFVESGTLTAWLHTEDDRLLRIRQVLPGAALGEIAFCTGTPRTASVIADTEAVVRVLRRDRFDEIALSDPACALAVQEELMRRMGVRLSAASAMVRDLLQ